MLPLVIIIALAAILVLPLTEAGSLATFALGAIVKGSRVGMASSPLLDANGNPTNEIGQNPEELAASANLDLDTYTGARVISSEEGNSPAIFQVAIGWATRNNATMRGSTIFEYATDGSFGEQGAGRPVSTWQDPYEGHVKIFQAIQAGQIADPTNGATMWIAPRAQDALNRRDPEKYKPFAEVDASRKSDGYVPVDIDGIDPSLLVMYRKA